MEKLTIYSKGIRNQAITDFVVQLEEAFRNGWKLGDTTTVEWSARSVGRNGFTIALCKGESPPKGDSSQEGENGSNRTTGGSTGIVENTLENPLENPLEALRNISKKADLLEFAEKVGINVPEDQKYPSQIKRYLEDELNKEGE